MGRWESGGTRLAMSLDFEWDRRKATANVRRHGVAFEEAATVFADTRSITIHDPDHSVGGEDRFITVGRSAHRRVLVVVHCDRGERSRLISAREATARERNAYHEENL
jgi:hypothetical protein